MLNTFPNHPSVHVLYRSYSCTYRFYHLQLLETLHYTGSLQLPNCLLLATYLFCHRNCDFIGCLPKNGSSSEMALLISTISMELINVFIIRCQRKNIRETSLSWFLLKSISDILCQLAQLNGLSSIPFSVSRSLSLYTQKRYKSRKY